MCGIAGVIQTNGLAAAQLAKTIGMAREMHHRGPDDEGFATFDSEGAVALYFGECTHPDVIAEVPDLRAIDDQVSDSIVTLVHRRLSILDISPAGHQPMRSACARYWVAFNGEIYNYVELREELRELGHEFSTQSDTEVILAAYAEWGQECSSRFNGDWALLLYDTERREVFVSRDRFGIKPLYYYQDESTLIFASEIKALLANPDVQARVDEEGVKAYLQSGTREWEEGTCFQNIWRFPFAHHAMIAIGDHQESWKAIRYWDLREDLSVETFDPRRARDIARSYYDILKDSVRIRLRSDVPLGCALSGGLDSSSIVYLADEILREQGAEHRLKTFSLVHQSAYRQYDESKFIDYVCDALDVDDHRTEPSDINLPEMSEIVQKYWESPPDGLGVAGFSTFELAKSMKLTVTLDGQGADEQQAGYIYYLPCFLGNQSFTSFFREAWGCFRVQGFRKHTLEMVGAGLLKALFGEKALARFATAIGKRADFEHTRLNAFLKQSTTRGLVNLLHYGDCRSMYYSMESRVPFMDHRLVEFMASVPECYKIHQGWSKYFARLAFEGKLPDEVVWRKDKMGWPTPEKEWMEHTFADWAQSETTGSPLLKKLNHHHLKQGLSLVKKIRLLNLAVWYRVFFGGRDMSADHRS